VTILKGIRAYHALLALSVVAAFLTGEAGTIHLVLGYAVAALLVARLFAGLSGLRQLGLARFYPQFDGLSLSNAATHPAISKTLLAGIAVTLIAATLSGIGLDRGAGLTAAFAEGHHGGGESALEGLHEGVSNALMGLVALHVGYLLVFKRPLARFMLFLQAPRVPAAGP